MLAKNSGEIVRFSQGHRIKHCRLHCKRKIYPVHDHRIVETQDHLVALKIENVLMRTHLLQVEASEADSASSDLAVVEQSSGESSFHC